MITFDKYMRDKNTAQSKTLSINKKLYESHLDEDYAKAEGGGEIDTALKGAAGAFLLSILEGKKIIRIAALYKKKKKRSLETAAAEEVEKAKSDQKFDVEISTFEDTWPDKVKVALQSITDRHKKAAARASYEKNKEAQKEALNTKKKEANDSIGRRYELLKSKADQDLTKLLEKNNFKIDYIKSKWSMKKEEIDYALTEEVIKKKNKALQQIAGADPDADPEDIKAMMERAEKAAEQLKKNAQAKAEKLKETAAKNQAEFDERMANASEDQKEAIAILKEYEQDFTNFVTAVQELVKIYEETNESSLVYQTFPQIFEDDDEDEDDEKIKAGKEKLKAARKKLSESFKKITPAVLKKGLKLSTADAEAYIDELKSEREEAIETLQETNDKVSKAIDSVEHAGDDEDDKAEVEAKLNKEKKEKIEDKINAAKEQLAAAKDDEEKAKIQATIDDLQTELSNVGKKEPDPKEPDPKVPEPKVPEPKVPEPKVPEPKEKEKEELNKKIAGAEKSLEKAKEDGKSEDILAKIQKNLDDLKDQLSKIGEGVEAINYDDLLEKINSIIAEIENIPAQRSIMSFSDYLATKR